MRTQPYVAAVAQESMDDAALIQQSLQHPEAFEQVYDRHATYIHRYVTRRLGADAADDVVADTFLDAFRHRRRYRFDRADARPWLYGIAANIIGKHRRSETRMLRALAKTGTDLVAHSYGDGIEDRVVAAAVRQPLGRALAALSPKYREVLLLIAWADLSYEEAAEALGISIGTVRSRLHRARKKVREALGGHNPTSSFEEIDR
jgi:RNA polymerase sigma factor (sigma-70 family)